MRTTNKFDCNNKEIFEGHKVIKCWGWFKSGNATKNRFQIHTITVNPSHLMANGEVHDDGNGIIFCLGNAYNYWEGKEVQILSEKEIKDISMPENTDFFFDEGKAILMKSHNFLGISPEDFEEFRKQVNQY